MAGARSRSWSAGRRQALPEMHVLDASGRLVFREWGQMFAEDVAAPARFAARCGARVAPVVRVVDADPTPLAQPLAGLDGASFYAVCLSNAIEQARRSCASAERERCAKPLRHRRRYGTMRAFGGVAERLKAPVLKTGKGSPFVSSNLTASATGRNKKTQVPPALAACRPACR